MLPTDLVRGASLRDILVDDENLSLFRTACSQLGLLDLELDSADLQFTLFVPTNTAIQANTFMNLYMTGVENDPPTWHEHLERSLRHHMVENAALTTAEIFDGTKTSLFTLEDSVQMELSFQTIGGAKILTGNITADNGMLHIIDRVMEPAFYKHSFQQLEEQDELGPDWLERVSLSTIVDFVNGREVLAKVVPEGQTQVACRTRALNRIGLFYLPKTLNRSPEIKFGEFLNETYKKETVYNLIEYSLPHKNFYRADLPPGHVEWIMSPNNCSHMLVTVSEAGTLCFNDGCVVEDPKPREWLANNGVGYIVDKCTVCSGVGMLLEYASVYLDDPILKDAAQFYETSEWNLRNLSMSVGNGSKITLFAARDNAYNVFNLEDVKRLSTDKWKRHQWNFLQHTMLQGEYYDTDFVRLWEENLGKPYNLTAISGENITIDYDKDRKMVRIDDGDIIKANIQGIDGYVKCFLYLEFFPFCACSTHIFSNDIESSPFLCY